MIVVNIYGEVAAARVKVTPAATGGEMAASIAGLSPLPPRLMFFDLDLYGIRSHVIDPRKDLGGGAGAVVGQHFDRPQFLPPGATPTTR